jgi:hypothetical protein
VLGGDHDGHADAAIEHAMHFIVGHVAVPLQPVEDRQAIPRGTRQARLHSRRQHARHVFEEAAAGDVRHPFHRNNMHQRQHRLDVDAGRREQCAADRRGVER